MAIAIFPMLLMIFGLLLYAISNNGKACEIGRIAYFCGLLVLAFHFGSHVIHILG